MWTSKNGTVGGTFLHPSAIIRAFSPCTAMYCMYWKLLHIRVGDIWYSSAATFIWVDPRPTNMTWGLYDDILCSIMPVRMKIVPFDVFIRYVSADNVCHSMIFFFVRCGWAEKWENPSFYYVATWFMDTLVLNDRFVLVFRQAVFHFRFINDTNKICNNANIKMIYNDFGYFRWDKWGGRNFGDFW